MHIMVTMVSNTILYILRVDKRVYLKASHHKKKIATLNGGDVN